MSLALLSTLSFTSCWGPTQQIYSMVVESRVILTPWSMERQALCGGDGVWQRVTGGLEAGRQHDLRAVEQIREQLCSLCCVRSTTDYRVSKGGLSSHSWHGSVSNRSTKAYGRFNEKWREKVKWERNRLVTSRLSGSLPVFKTYHLSNVSKDHGHLKKIKIE